MAETTTYPGDGQGRGLIVGWPVRRRSRRLAVRTRSTTSNRPDVALFSDSLIMMTSLEPFQAAAQERHRARRAQRAALRGQDDPPLEARSRRPLPGALERAQVHEPPSTGTSVSGARRRTGATRRCAARRARPSGAHATAGHLARQEARLVGEALDLLEHDRVGAERARVAVDGHRVVAPFRHDEHPLAGQDEQRFGSRAPSGSARGRRRRATSRPPPDRARPRAGSGRTDAPRSCRPCPRGRGRSRRPRTGKRQVFPVAEVAVQTGNGQDRALLVHGEERGTRVDVGPIHARVVEARRHTAGLAQRVGEPHREGGRAPGPARGQGTARGEPNGSRSASGERVRSSASAAGWRAPASPQPTGRLRGVGVHHGEHLPERVGGQRPRQGRIAR